MTSDQATHLAHELKGVYRGLSDRFDDLDRKVTDGFAAVHESQRQQDAKIEGLEKREQYREGERAGWSRMKVWGATLLTAALSSGIAVGLTRVFG